MERLTVKNLGSLKNVNINIPRLLVLIGDQASGKTTLAKVVYMFKKLSEQFCGYAVSRPNVVMTDENEIIKYIKSQFKKYFATCFYNGKTLLKYSYSNGYFIEVKVSDTDEITVSFSSALTNLLKNLSVVAEKMRSQPSKAVHTKEDAKHFSKMFELMVRLVKVTNACSVFEYIYAAREGGERPLLGETTLGKSPIANDNAYSDFIELLRDFKNREKIKANFIKNISSEYLESHNSADINQKAELCCDALSLAHKLLQGTLSVNSEGEFGITLNNKSKTFVPYRHISSGQNSLTPVVTALSLISNSPAMFPESIGFNSAIIGEPEAHIYPNNQFAIVKMIAMAMMINNDSRFIVTTHSPYILASIHALAAYGQAWKKGCAAQVAQNHENIVPLFSDRENLEIYLLERGMAESLRDEETELFDTSKIDSASDEINEVFDEAIAAMAYAEDAEDGECTK